MLGLLTESKATMDKKNKEKAIVYCENEFGRIDGKTANGLVRHSDLYDIVGIIDSSLAGQDAGLVLGEARNHVPIFSHLDEALDRLSTIPDCYIYGKAPLETCISADERSLIIEAIEKGMDIVNGLHQFFTEDEEFIQHATRCDVTIYDMRKAPAVENLHTYSGRIDEVKIPVIAVLGTDCACGKMTTAIELDKALNQCGLKSVFIATGQTSLMQGAKYGVSIDALISQFVIGEIEHLIVTANESESPDIILVEGQGAVSHPAFMSSLGILRGCKPDGIILQHAPARKQRCDFPNLIMPTIASEIVLIETISQARVMGITLNHEALSRSEMVEFINEYETQFKLPTTDVLIEGCDKIIECLCKSFPLLKEKMGRENLESLSALCTVLT